VLSIKVVEVKSFGIRPSTLFSAHVEKFPINLHYKEFAY
jgi:hypothetical protein